MRDGYIALAGSNDERFDPWVPLRITPSVVGAGFMRVQRTLSFYLCVCREREQEHACKNICVCAAAAVDVAGRNRLCNARAVRYCTVCKNLQAQLQGNGVQAPTPPMGEWAMRGQVHASSDLFAVWDDRAPIPVLRAGRP